MAAGAAAAPPPVCLIGEDSLTSAALEVRSSLTILPSFSRLVAAPRVPRSGRNSFEVEQEERSHRQRCAARNELSGSAGKETRKSSLYPGRCWKG